MSICNFLSYFIISLTLVAFRAGGLDHILIILIGFIVAWLIVGGWLLFRKGFDGTCWAVRLFDLIFTKVLVKLSNLWGFIKRCLKGWPRKDEFYDSMYDTGGEIICRRDSVGSMFFFGKSREAVTDKFQTEWGLWVLNVKAKFVIESSCYSLFLLGGCVIAGSLLGVAAGYVTLSSNYFLIDWLHGFFGWSVRSVVPFSQVDTKVPSTQLIIQQAITLVPDRTYVSVVSFFKPVEALVSLFDQSVLSASTNRPVTSVSLEQSAIFARSIGMADLSVLCLMFPEDPQCGELFVKLSEELGCKLSSESWSNVSWFWNVLVNSGLIEIRDYLVKSGLSHVERELLINTMLIVFSDSAEALVRSVSRFSDVGTICPVELYVAYLENGGGCLFNCWRSAFKAALYVRFGLVVD